MNLRLSFCDRNSRSAFDGIEGSKAKKIMQGDGMIPVTLHIQSMQQRSKYIYLLR